MHTAFADGGAEESSDVFYLVTSLLDVEDYPALDLACCYPRRVTLTLANSPKIETSRLCY